MTRRWIALPALAAVAAATTLAPAAASAADHTQTLRFFERTVAMKLTHADGTVVDHAPFPDVQPGDTLEISTLDYVGDHAHHAKRWTASSLVTCAFAQGAPDCRSQVAVGGSVLVFQGSPGTLVGGSGAYRGATGRVVSSKDVEGGSDIVARITLR